MLTGSRYWAFALFVSAAACGAEVAPPAAQRAPARQMVPDGPVVERLDAHGAASLPAPVVQRNPFRFERSRAGGDAPDAMRDLPPAESLPELPLPIPQPPLRLLGIATDEGEVRVAVISVGRDLVLAKIGDRLADRFEVTGISADAVDLTDAAGQRSMRLALP